ncbi:hypothetical protein ACLOJK_032940 [Asimina triloba]
MRGTVLSVDRPGEKEKKMTKEEFLKIQTCVLKVNLHCDGCKQKVKKLLQKIEGVYTVNIDAEQQKVTVSGNVDSAVLIKKLVRAGKHAEFWSPQKSNQNKKPQQAQCIKDEKNSKEQKQGLIKGLKAFKTQNFPAFSYEDDDFDEDEDDIDEEDDLRFLRERVNHMGLLRQAGGPNGASKAVAAAANSKVANAVGNGNVGKNAGGNPHQNAGMKNPGGGPQGQKSINGAGNNKMNNVAHLAGIGNPNAGESKRVNEINGMGLGFHPSHGGGAALGLGGGGGGIGGPAAFHQQNTNNNFQGSGFPPSGFGGLHQPSPMMMNGMQGYQQQHPSSTLMNMNMNMQNRMMHENRYMQPQMMHENRYMQPQMMYNRSPVVYPYTGYYYNPQPSYYQSESADYGTHMFSDENTSSSCAIM